MFAPDYTVPFIVGDEVLIPQGHQWSFLKKDLGFVDAWFDSNTKIKLIATDPGEVIKPWYHTRPPLHALPQEYVCLYKQLLNIDYKITFSELIDQVTKAKLTFQKRELMIKITNFQIRTAPPQLLFKRHNVTCCTNLTDAILAANENLVMWNTIRI